jgi:hypothetical protein
MGDYRLARPPLIDTTIPTSENFYTGHAVDAPEVNVHHRYAPDATGINALALTPAGHGKGSNAGIWASVLTMDSSTGGAPVARLAFHPNSRSIQDYVSKWEVEEEPLASIEPDADIWSHAVRSDIASQRLGNYVYAFASYSTAKVTEFFDFFPSRIDATQGIIIKRIGPNKSITTRLVQDCSTYGDGDDRHVIPHLGFYENKHHQFFVSDDATPFIWTTFGDISDAASGYFGFADTGSSFGTLTQNIFTARYTATGQLGAFYQNTYSATGTSFGPVLVFPWRCGNYGAPELWYFVMRGIRQKAVFDIYAARWKRHQYQRVPNLTLGDDPDFEAGTRRFPTGNPDGYAFEYDWFHKSKKVGTVGPFPNGDVWNQVEDPFGFEDSLVRWPGFRVVRDYNRIGRMQFIMANNGPRAGT